MIQKTFFTQNENVINTYVVNCMENKLIYGSAGFIIKRFLQKLLLCNKISMPIIENSGRMKFDTHLKYNAFISFFNPNCFRNESAVPISIPVKIQNIKKKSSVSGVKLFEKYPISPSRSAAQFCLLLKRNTNMCLHCNRLSAGQVTFGILSAIDPYASVPERRHY